MDDPLAAIRHLYPFESRYVTLGGQRMHYVDEGSGPPIVMLHGNPTWSFHYRDLIKELAGDYRVIAPDHIGCGLSEKPQNYPYRLAQHIENLDALLEHLNLNAVTLAVHDWGGAIGFGWAMRRPERARRFIVFNTAAFLGPVPWRIRICRLPLLGSIAVRQLNLFLRGALCSACKNKERMRSDVKRGYLLPYPSPRSRVAIHRFVQDIPTSPLHPTYPLIESIDRSLRRFSNQPMVIFWGTQDFCFNLEFMHAWMDRFPRVELHRFDFAGHFVVEDAGEYIIPAVRAFMARTAVLDAAT